MGVEHKASDRVTWGANYTLVGLGRNTLDTSNAGGRVVGDYDAYVHILGIYGSLSF